MSNHISYLDRFTVYWSEDQPIVRPARVKFEQEGVIGTLIEILENGNEEKVEEYKEYGYFGRQQKYLCRVSEYPAEFRTSDTDPKYMCYIRFEGATTPWDAIGEVYAGIPDHFIWDLRERLVDALNNYLSHRIQKKHSHL